MVFCIFKKVRLICERTKGMFVSVVCGPPVFGKIQQISHNAEVCECFPKCVRLKDAEISIIINTDQKIK